MALKFLKLGFVSICLFLLAGLLNAETVKIVEKNNDFLITKWTTEEGLPQNTVTSIVQTADGYIWLGTFGGLARFDGVKFTVFNSANSPSLTSNRIRSLHEDNWDRLWIGTETGEVFTLTDGGFRLFEAGTRRV